MLYICGSLYIGCSCELDRNFPLVQWICRFFHNTFTFCFRGPSTVSMTGSVFWRAFQCIGAVLTACSVLAVERWSADCCLDSAPSWSRSSPLGCSRQRWSVRECYNKPNRRQRYGCKTWFYKPCVLDILQVSSHSWAHSHVSMCATLKIWNGPGGESIVWCTSLKLMLDMIIKYAVIC